MGQLAKQSSVLYTLSADVFETSTNEKYVDFLLNLYAKTVKIEDKTVRYSEMFPKLMIPDTEKTN